MVFVSPSTVPRSPSPATTPICSPRWREELAVWLAQGRLLPVGTMRVLHRARRRPRPSSAANLSLEKVAGRDGSRRSRVFPTTSANRMASAFRGHGRAAVRASALPGSSCGSRRCSRRRGPTSTATPRPATSGAHLCRCTGYVKILDAGRTARQGRDHPARNRSAAIGTSGEPLPGLRPRARRQGPTSDDMRPAPGCCTVALRLADHGPGPTCCASTRPRAARPCPVVVRVLTAADVSRARCGSGLIHKDWPVLHSRRRPHVVPR